jgi:hypothetical protein
MSAYDWYAIRIRPSGRLPLRPGKDDPRLEFDILYALTQREHQAMVPFEVKWEKRKNLRVPKKFPLFPCYVFGRFCSYRDFQASKDAINQRAIDIGKNPPILGLAGYGPKPAKLSQGDVALIEATSLPEITQINLHKAIRAGGRASIIARGHALEGHTVTIDSVTRSKCKILLNILGSMKTVEIDASALEAA